MIQLARPLVRFDLVLTPSVGDVLQSNLRLRGKADEEIDSILYGQQAVEEQGLTYQGDRVTRSKSVTWRLVWVGLRFGRTGWVIESKQVTNTYCREIVGRSDKEVCLVVRHRLCERGDEGERSQLQVGCWID